MSTRNFGNAIICVFWLWTLDIKYIIWAIWCNLQIKYFLIAFFYHKWLIFIYRCNQKFHVFNPLWPRFFHRFSMNFFTAFQGPYSYFFTISPNDAYLLASGKCLLIMWMNIVTALQKQYYCHDIEFHIMCVFQCQPTALSGASGSKQGG